MMLNSRSYLQYFERLKQLGMSMFEWKNLPETVDERFMELILFDEGKVLFFKDEELGYLTLQCAFDSQLDVYRNPIKRKPIAINGYNFDVRDKSNSVIIYNNYLRTNSVLDVMQFARRLYSIDRIIDVNVRAQKTPVLITASEGQRLTLLNVYEQYDGDEPVIFGDKNLDPKSVGVLKTDAPYVADKLYQLKVQYWNEALTYLGISNVNFQKKERLISDEVSRQQGGIIANRYSRLQARRQAAEKINEMFGLEIEVNFRDDFREIDDEFIIEGETGGDEITTMVKDMRSNYTGVGGQIARKMGL